MNVVSVDILDMLNSIKEYLKWLRFCYLIMFDVIV